MSAPVDFAPIRLTQADERQGRKQMRQMLGRDWWRIRGRATWAGFAAERALVRAVRDETVRGGMRASLSNNRHHDLELVIGPGCGAVTTVEVKTRAVVSGWDSPARFDYLTIPTHEGREPIKDVDLIWFCWYTMSQPRRLWVLGFLKGPEEFKRRAVFYREGEPMPRGWAGPGGAWCIEVKQLRPLPRGLFLEDG